MGAWFTFQKRKWIGRWIQKIKNSLEFFTDRGQYELFHIKIISNLEKIEYPTYYFEISHEEFLDIEDADLTIDTILEFIDDRERKSGYISINNRRLHFDTREITFTQDISEEIVEGNNAIVLVPTQTLDVREFRVEMED